METKILEVLEHITDSYDQIKDINSKRAFIKYLMNWHRNKAIREWARETYNKFLEVKA